MGRHKSRRESDRNASKRRRHHESSPSTDDEDRRKNARLERLERIVDSLDRQSSTRDSCIHRGNELMIPVYDPSKDDLVIEKWIEHVDELATQYNWNDRAIMRLIPGRLKGHARQWYDTRPRLAVTWEETKESLKQQFCKSVPFSRLFKEAALYESAPGQALGDYCFQKLNKMRKLDIKIPDKYLIDAVIGGITDENVARMVRSARHQDANELYAYMTTLGSLPSKNERNKATFSTKNDRKDRGIKSLDQSRAENVENSKPIGKVVTNDSASRIECFNCGKAGHIARKYRMLRVECEQCSRLGHRAEKCPLKGEVNVIKETGTASNLYEISITLNGHKIWGLIDSGSSCTLVRASIAKKYNLNISSTPKKILRGFAGQLSASSQSANCEIKIMNATATINALIVPDDHLMHDVMIGHDFLEQEHITIIKRKNNLIFEQLTAMNDDKKYVIGVNFSSVQDNTFAISTGDISEEARQECVSLIQEFRDCVALSIRELGKTDATALSIRCTTGEPIVYRPYRLAESERVVVREMIRELLDNRIIRKSNSPYASPILLVKKKSGEHRMCVDFRK